MSTTGEDRHLETPATPSGATRTRHRSKTRPCTVAAQRVEVTGPGRLPPAARVHPLLTLFVGEDEPSPAAPQLHALFALLDQVGAAEVYHRTAARTSWKWQGGEHPSVALRLEITEPAEARGLLEVMMDADAYRQAWSAVRDAHWIGITTSARLHPHEDGSATGLDEVFAACIPISSTPPPAPPEPAGAQRPRSSRTG